MVEANYEFIGIYTFAFAEILTRGCVAVVMWSLIFKSFRKISFKIFSFIFLQENIS